MEIIENVTNPGQPLAEGDFYTFRIGKHIGGRVWNPEKGPSEEEIRAEARRWRDEELQATDWIVPVTDHPQHAAYMAHRQTLRDWPSTDTFPDTRPELGA